MNQSYSPGILNMVAFCQLYGSWRGLRTHAPQWAHSTTVPALSWAFGTLQMHVDP